MKVRNGFISNSSSSSFIVAVKNGKESKITISLEVDLKHYTKTTIFTLEELDNWFIERYGMDTIEEFLCSDRKEQYFMAKEQIEKGNKVLCGEFSTASEPIEELLCNMGIKEYANDNVEVILSDEGY